MDGTNHNFLLSENCNVLGYSFMTFEIKDKIETSASAQGNEFDITPFNYLFNKSTSIIDSNDLLDTDYVAFEKLLQKIMEFNPDYLEQLNYYEFNGKKKYSTLHIAIYDEDSDRDAELILKYLSKMSISLGSYSDILDELVGF